MKPTLQAIAIASDPQMKINIMTGYKNITIREGQRDYHLGDVILFDEKDSWVVRAKIIDIQHKTMSQITEAEWRADGFVSQKDMMKRMKRFYPKITLESPVTVVRWDINSLSGFWVEKLNIETFAKSHGIEHYL